MLTYWPKTEYRCITRCTARSWSCKALNRSAKETRTHSWWEGQRFIGSHELPPFIHSRDALVTWHGALYAQWRFLLRRVLLREDVARCIVASCFNRWRRWGEVLRSYSCSANVCGMIPHSFAVCPSRAAKENAVNIYMYVLKRERHLENYGLQHANVINVGNNSVTRTYARTHIWIFNFASCLSVSLSRDEYE